MKKKLLSTLMAMIMVLSMFPAAALEESVDPQSSGTTATEASGQEPDTTEDGWTEVSGAEALGAALTNGGNIKLTASIEVSEKQNWTVDGKEVVLDLNDCTIRSSYGEMNNFIMTVKNGGSLTVTDNSADKGGKIEATDSSYGYGIRLYSESSFTLQAGTIETTQETVDIYDSTSNCIVDIAGGKLISTTDNVLGVRGNGTKVTITGGELVSNGRTGVYISCYGDPDSIQFTMTGGKLTHTGGMSGAIQLYKGATVTIDGTAEIESTSSYAVQVQENTILNVEGGNLSSSGSSAISCGETSTVNISGGEISSTTTSTTSGVISAEENATVNITGGKISTEKQAVYAEDNASVSISGDAVISTSSTSASDKIVNTDGSGSISVTGGTFQNADGGKVDVSGYLPEGTTQDESGNVVVDESKAVASIGNVGYTTLAAAVEAAKDGDTIMILQDITVTSAISPKKTLTFRGAVKGDDTKVKVSGSSGLFSQSGAGVFTLENLNLEATGETWYIYHSAGPLHINNCDFTMAAGVTKTGNLIMGEGKPATDETYSLTFTNNTVNANSRAAIVGIGNNSVITHNTFDLISERHGDTDSRTSILSLCAAAGKGAVEITHNTFKNANRALAVDNSTLEAESLTFNQNRFIDVRFAFELNPDGNKDCGIYDINKNYYNFNGTVSEPKVQDASSDGDKFSFGEGTAEYRPAAGSESQVSNNEYYLRPEMEPDDLNTYIPPSSGGGGGSSSYSISVDKNIDNGSVTVSPKSASSGRTVTITVKADEGYELDELTVTDKNGDEIELTDKGDGRYTFKMPRSKVTIEASFVEIDHQDTCPAAGFRDVDEDAWYHEAVDYALDNGLMSGVSDREFAPGSTLTRAMVAQMLYSLEGKPAAGSADFADVAEGAWYADAISWAASEGIVSGYGDTFGPNDPITREQLAAILYRYAQNEGYKTSQSGKGTEGYLDASSISSYAVKAMDWAVNAGLLSGKGNNTLAPTAGATRAEVAQIFMNFCEDIAK